MVSVIIIMNIYLHKLDVLQKYRYKKKAKTKP